MRALPKPLIRFVLVLSLLASIYVIYLMASGIRRKSGETKGMQAERLIERLEEKGGESGPPRVKHMKVEEEEEENEEDEEEEKPNPDREKEITEDEENDAEKQAAKRRNREKEEEAAEEKKRQRQKEEREEEARAEAKKKERVKEEKEPKRPTNFHFRTENHVMLTIMNPFAYRDDQHINCVPLQSAYDKEAICTYSNAQDKVISKVLNQKEVWEGDIVRTMKKILWQDPALGLIDIGASLGVFTLTAASMNHKVVSVEPFPPNLKHLAKTMRENVDIARQVKVVTNPVSNQYEIMHFFKKEKHPGGTQLHSETEAWKGDDHEEVEDMEATSILTDDLLELIKFKKAVLKVDISGGEYKALQSAYKLFENLDVTHVIMEWEKNWKTTEKRDFFLAFFKVRGYSVHRATPELEKLEFSDTASQNWPVDIVFIKQS